MNMELGYESGMHSENPSIAGQKFLGREFKDVGFLEDEEISSKVGGLFKTEYEVAEKNSEQLLNWIAGWQGAEAGRSQRLQDLDTAIGSAMDQHGGINWNTLILLAEVEPSRPSVYAHFKIVEALERHPEFLTARICERIEELAKDPNPESQVVVHKLCDFFIGVAVTSQFQEQPDDESLKRNEVLLGNIYDLANKQIGQTSNYLLASHWEDVVETIKGSHSKKPDRIAGVPGESSDYIIITYNEFVLLQSYYNSILAGKQHFDPEQPLIPVAKGYLGQYKRGQLQEVLTEDYSRLEEIYKMDKELVLQNGEENDSIYFNLNNNLPENQRWVLSSFLRRINKEDKEFYFNIINDDLDDPNHPKSKILNPQTIYPEVLAEILAHNYGMLQQRVQPDKAAEPLNAQEYLERLFPTGKYTAAEAYLYLDMVSLQRRKRIEQDLGENLANIPAYGQVHLLKYLASRNKEDFERVKGVADRWSTDDQNLPRQDFLLSFLAYGEDPANAEVVLELAETLPSKLSAAVFAKYAEIAAGCERVGEFVEQKFHHTQIAEQGVQAIIKDLFANANLLLRHIAKEATRTQSVERLTDQLEAFRSEVALYVSVVGQLRKERKVSLEEEIEKNTIVKKGGKFTKEEMEEMRKMFSFGRAEVFPEELKAQSNAEFDHKLNDSKHTFYLFRPEGKIVAFLHTDPVKNADGSVKDKAVYVGSLNVSPEGRGGALGVVFTKYFLEKYGIDNDIYADVLEVNTRALGLYTKFLGFRQRKDDPFSIIKGEKDGQFKNINIIREKRPEKAEAVAA
jgi:ribosomal protein S18 acetylase RimI-like enzyme